MTTESHRETATIYSFPARGRFATGADRHRADRPGEQSQSPPVADSGWYHDEAIREERERKDH